MQKPDQALAEANKAIQLKPDYYYAYIARSRALKALGRSDEARNDYIKVTEFPVDEKDATSFCHRAAAYSLLGKFELALQDYAKAVSIDPSNMGAYYSRAGVYSKLKKFDEAIDDYSKILNLDSGDSDALLSRAMVYAKKKQMDKAMADWNRAHERKPDSEDCYGTLTLIHLWSGRPHEAVEAAQKGLAVNPKALWITSNLVDAYVFDNQFEKAKEICLKHQHDQLNDRFLFSEGILDDFKQLKEQGISHPDTEKIAQLFRGMGYASEVK